MLAPTVYAAERPKWEMAAFDDLPGSAFPRSSPDTRRVSRAIVPGDAIAGHRVTGLHSDPTRVKGNLACVSFDDGDGIVTPRKCLVATGDRIAGHRLIAICGDPAQNALGDIAFWAAFVGGHGIFTRDRLVAALGDTIDGFRLTAVFGDPALSDTGVVVFRASFLGGQGLFTSDRCLLATGDVINGERVTELAGTVITGTGDVLAVVRWADGTQALVQASAIVSRRAARPRSPVRPTYGVQSPAPHSVMSHSVRHELQEPRRAGRTKFREGGPRTVLAAAAQ